MMWSEITSLIQTNLISLDFYLPLGLVGVWRWWVWLIKEIGALFYRPRVGHYSTTVSIVVPVYNEKPEVFKRALHSWQFHQPHEIIAVIDQTDQSSIEIFQQFSQHFSNTRLIVTPRPGKRAALVDGIRVAQSEIVALVDSDTIWTNTVLPNAVTAFQDSAVAGVTVRQNIWQPQTLAQKIFDIQLDLRYFDEIPFLAATGDALICLSGRTAFYRRQVILPMLDDLINETFWGRAVISGDDKRLTHLVQAAGWKTAYQNNALVLTPGEKSLRTYFKQRLRWTRNALRADMRALWQGWVWQHPSLAFFMIDKIIQSFTTLLSPIYFSVAFINQDWFFVGLLASWWLASRTIKIYPHLRRRPQDIVVVPFFIGFTFMSALLKVYALFTLNTQGWITRWHASRLPQFKFIEQAPAYLSTVIVITGLTGVVHIAELNFSQGSVLPILVQNTVLAETDPNLVLGARLKNAEDLMLKRYEVRPGDTLIRIGQRFNIEPSEIIRYNSAFLPSPSRIQPGLILTLPVGKNLYQPTRIYSTDHDRSPLQIKIGYEPETNTIQVDGRGQQVDLNQIRAWVGKKYLDEIEPGVWYLQANLSINTGVILRLDRGEVEWLKMKSQPQDFIWLRTFGGMIEMNGVKITSWDMAQNDVDQVDADGRSFITAKFTSRMDIYEAEIAYLGYFPPPTDVSSPYGIAWKVPNDELREHIVTGEVKNSRFHHNYFGAYTYGATSMVWQNNQFYENIRYGLDPHDYSNSFIVEANQFFKNGAHGLIFSKGCFNNLVINNRSFDNQGHGIMIHKYSDHNTVYGNEVYGNQDGIVIYDSNYNRVEQNRIYQNQQGIRINANSQNNSISHNKVILNESNGIYIYDQAQTNQVMENSVYENRRGIYLKSSGNTVQSNLIELNQVGLRLADEAIAETNLVNNEIYENEVDFE